MKKIVFTALLITLLIPFVFVSAKNSPTIPLETITTTSDQISKVPSLSFGTHSVYIHEVGTPSNTGIYINSKLPLHTASLIKIPIAIIALKVVERENLNNLISDTLIQDMVVNHSENSTNTIIKTINQQGYQFKKELIDIGLTESNVNMRIMSSESIGFLLEKLSTNSLGLRRNDFLLNTLSTKSNIDDGNFTWSSNSTLNGDFIHKVGAIYNQPQQVPYIGVVKYVTNDSGILTVSDGRKFVIVLLGNYQTENEYQNGKNFIHEIIPILNNMISQPTLPKK